MLSRDVAENHRSSRAVEDRAYSLDASEIASQLNVDCAVGLSSADADERRSQVGPNAIQSIRPPSALRILLDQFASAIVVLLSVASLIAWVTGDRPEALAIIAVLVINALAGFAIEWRASQALDALRRQARATARVMRDGHQKNLDAVELVPGDVVILNSGDRVPADSRLITARSLRAEESALTGESATSEKSSEPAAIGAPLADRHSMVYLGTTIAAGHAVAVVTATGARTELGRIGRLVAEAQDEQTPLERRLAQLGHRLIYIVLVIAAVVMAAGLMRGDGLWLMAEVAISLAVAAVPEGLPAVTTLILALGVLRMARQNAIVRRLPAVETLGSTSIICADKTGTLTENRMTVREYELANDSRVTADSQWSTEDEKSLRRAVRASVLCNEASLTPTQLDGDRAVGDPTETALLIAADEMGIDVRALRDKFPKLIEVPFDARSQRMISVHREPSGDLIAFLKGGPAVVLNMCASYIDARGSMRALDDEARNRFLATNEGMAGRALRVLALADKSLDSGHRVVLDSVSDLETNSEMQSGYIFLGFVGMIDPPRAEVSDAIERARQAGIRVVMLTGDQINTARAIARELRLNGDQPVEARHARDLEGLDHDRLAELARTVNVFARVSPEDKLRIVEALVEAGEVVAVTGDGVNDAPALKRASTGIAMGERGTEAAKEAADIVLADDNFATILKAVEGGRAIYANIIKFVHMMFSHNLAEVLVIFLSIVIGWPLPLLPLQILWMNLVTDVFPALALAVDPPAPGLMQRPPRSAGSSLLSRKLAMLVAWQAAVLAAITLSIYAWALSVYGEGTHSRTVALMAIIGVQLGHMFNCRSRTRSALAGLFRNPQIWGATAIVIGLQLMAVYLNPLARVLNTTHLTASDWLLACGALISPIIVVEITKWAARRRAAQIGAES